jgi:D-lactate dehydrogenase (cytochrome)
VGGIASTGAKGICSHLYGGSNSYIDGIRFMTAEGSIHEIKKGQAAVFVNGKSIDLLDVYLGGEGMYGVITELILRLIPKPKEIWGICFFFEDIDDGLSFADHIKDTSFSVEGAEIAAIEYLDGTTIDAIEQYKQHVTKLKDMPDIETSIAGMVYLEIHGAQEEAVEEIAEAIMMAVVSFNMDPAKTWAFSGEREIEKMRNFLHAADETAILQLEKVRLEDQRITKLGIDMSLEEASLKTSVRRFGKNLNEKKLTAGFFGHIGSNRLHINIVPKNYGDYVRGRTLLEKWAEKYPGSCGSAITAYGIGKLKKSIFLKTASKADIEDIIQLKKQLDKNNLWNPGNMIEV